MSAILKKPHSFAQLKVSDMSFPANDGVSYTPFANRTWMFKREYRQKWRTVMSFSMFYLWFKLTHWEMQTRSLQHSFFGWNLRSICEPLQLFPFFLRLLFHSSPSLPLFLPSPPPPPLLQLFNHPCRFKDHLLVLRPEPFTSTDFYINTLQELIYMNR